MTYEDAIANLGGYEMSREMWRAIKAAQGDAQKAVIDFAETLMEHVDQNGEWIGGADVGERAMRDAETALRDALGVSDDA